MDGVELGIAHRGEQLRIEIVHEIVLAIETFEVVIGVLGRFTGLKAATKEVTEGEPLNQTSRSTCQSNMNALRYSTASDCRYFCSSSCRTLAVRLEGILQV